MWGAVGDLVGKHPGKTKTDEAQISAIRTGAVPAVYTRGQDSCADRHVAVTSVQVGCPCVILSHKQVFVFLID